MFVQIIKSAWLPVIGQSFIVIALDNSGIPGERFGEILTVAFQGDRQTTIVNRKSFSVKLPTELFDDKTVMKLMADVAQNDIINQVFENRKKLGLDSLAYFSDLSFSESNIKELMFAFALFRSIDKLKKAKLGHLLSDVLFKITTANDWSVSTTDQ
jgi:hypothetical protein